MRIASALCAAGLLGFAITNVHAQQEPRMAHRAAGTFTVKTDQLVNDPHLIYAAGHAVMRRRGAAL